MFTLQIDTGNAAFSDPEDARTEIARILVEVAGKLHPFHMVEGEAKDIYDVNGNKVGSWAVDAMEE